jgi:hypothetical protein
MKSITKPIPDKAKKLVKLLIDTGCTITHAAKQIGYKGNSARVTASTLLHRPDVQEYYLQQVRNKIGYSSHKALNNVLQLSDNASSEYVKLEASKDLLDRAGFKPVDKNQHIVSGDFSIHIDLK